MSDQRTILASVDLGDSTESILQTAFDLASTSRAELVVVHVLESFLGVDWSTPKHARSLSVLLQTRTQKALDAYLAGRLPTLLGKVEVQVVMGAAAREIVGLAARVDADCIVVGTHNKKGVERMLLGSVSEKVSRMAGCPVVVVREKNHDPAMKIPEIEPVCVDCAKVREQTDGAQLWCSRHSESHIRAHVYSSAGRSESPEAWSSTTGGVTPTASAIE